MAPRVHYAHDSLRATLDDQTLIIERKKTDSLGKPSWITLKKVQSDRYWENTPDAGIYEIITSLMRHGRARSPKRSTVKAKA